MMGAIAFQKDLGAGPLVRARAVDRRRPAPRPRQRRDDRPRDAASTCRLGDVAKLGRARSRLRQRPARRRRRLSEEAAAASSSWLAELKASRSASRRSSPASPAGRTLGACGHPSAWSRSRYADLCHPTNPRPARRPTSSAVRRGALIARPPSSPRPPCARSASRACSSTPTRSAPIFKGMTLQYIEQNVAHWLMQRESWRSWSLARRAHAPREDSAARSTPTPTSSTAWC
jgi:hypothetical protein